jgi:hypothetical protein
VSLLRLIGVNGMRQKNAGAEKSHQYCCKLNHGTHPYAQPAQITCLIVKRRFVSGRFRRPLKMVSSLISPGSTASSRTQGSQGFYPVVIAGSRCKPDQVRIWKMTAWTDVSHFIAGTRSGADIGERTWVKSSDLYRG